MQNEYSVYNIIGILQTSIRHLKLWRHKTGNLRDSYFTDPFHTFQYCKGQLSSDHTLRTCQCLRIQPLPWILSMKISEASQVPFGVIPSSQGPRFHCQPSEGQQALQVSKNPGQVQPNTCGSHRLHQKIEVKEGQQDALTLISHFSTLPRTIWLEAQSILTNRQTTQVPPAIVSFPTLSPLHVTNGFI